jgi:LysR family hydrogen peroxide-inducible transcriptional activator
MELYQLQSVLAVAHLKNFTKAAEAMSISQSALSQQIARLENELGIQLFDRSNKTIRLFPAGEEFIRHAEKLVNDYDMTVRVMSAYKQMKRGSVRIGGFPIVGSYPLVEVITGFMHEFSDIDTTYVEAESLELIEMLDKSSIDVGLLNYVDFKGRGIQYYDLLSDELVAIFDERHPFAGKTAVDLLDLKNEKFIMTTDNSTHYFDVINACVSRGFTPNVVFSCRDIVTMFGFIRTKWESHCFPQCVAEP